MFSVGCDVLLTIFQKASKLVNVVKDDSVCNGILVVNVTARIDDD